MLDSVGVIQDYRVSTGLSYGELTIDPGESCRGGWNWVRRIMVMATTSADIFFWNLGWE